MKKHSDSKSKYSEDEIIMLEFFVGNIFVVFGWKYFQQRSNFFIYVPTHMYIVTEIYM